MDLAIASAHRLDIAVVVHLDNGGGQIVPSRQPSGDNENKGNGHPIKLVGPVHLFFSFCCVR